MLTTRLRQAEFQNLSMILLLRMMASESSAKTVQTLSATNKRTDVIIAAELKWPHISIGIGDGLPAMKAQPTSREQVDQPSNFVICSTPPPNRDGLWHHMVDEMRSK